jgi:hypothetical protein
MKDQIQSFLAALVARFSPLFLWRSTDRVDLSGVVRNGLALVTVVGREHYTERKKSYPIRGWLDAYRVARNERTGTATLVHVGPWIEPNRVVTFFDLDPNFDLETERSLLLVPESLLIARSLAPGSVAEVERGGVRYFVSSDAVSQIAGGLIRTVEHFVMAVGLGSQAEVVSVDRAALMATAAPQLRQLAVGDWPGLLHPLVPGTARRRGVRVAAGGGIIFLVYLSVVSAYLLSMISWRSQELEALGPQVDSLLVAQREVATAATQVSEMDKLLSDRISTYRLWSGVAIVWQKGGNISGVDMVDGEVTIRGGAPSATDVLSALSGEQRFADARFVAPVRQVGDLQEFSITLRITDAGGPR